MNIHSKKSKAHIRYRLKDNSIVPGTTTITGSELGWNKQILISWANCIGLEGISSSKYRDERADIGTLAHAMVTDWLLSKKTETDDYSKNQIAAAENSALSFFEWANHKKIRPILVEKPLVSEKYRFGGTPDIYANIDSVNELIDLKTGSGIYPEMVIQASTYKYLLVENGYPVESVRILNIPRTEDEAFFEQKISKAHQDIAWKIFLNCLANYYLKREMK